MAMATEHSAGGVVYTYRGGRRLYVVVTELDGHTGLPKGHLERGETTAQAALREIREETGLTVALLPGHELEECYTLPRGGEKLVTYFIAHFEGQQIACDRRHVRSVLLLPLEEALIILTFAGARRILQEADAILEGMA